MSPQASDEDRAKWKSDSEAVAFLRSKGYVLNKNWTWKKPTPFHSPSKEEVSAIWYLVEEWDYGVFE